jgi:hypothetical protein
MKRTITIEIDRCSDCKHANRVHMQCSLVSKWAVCSLRSIPKWCPLLKKGVR